jgi:hypothetical protein
MSRTIESTDMPAAPPWPIISCADGAPPPAAISCPRCPAGISRAAAGARRLRTPGTADSPRGQGSRRAPRRPPPHRRPAHSRPRGGLLLRVTGVGRYRLASAVVAAFLHPPTEPGDRCPRGIEGDRGCLRHRVGLHGPHPGAVADRPDFPGAHASHQAHHDAGTHQRGRTPRILQPSVQRQCRWCLAVGAPRARWSKGMLPCPWAPFSRPGACTGGSRHDSRDMSDQDQHAV